MSTYKRLNVRSLGINEPSIDIKRDKQPIDQLQQICFNLG